MFTDESSKANPSFLCSLTLICPIFSFCNNEEVICLVGIALCQHILSEFVHYNSLHISDNFSISSHFSAIANIQVLTGTIEEVGVLD